MGGFYSSQLGPLHYLHILSNLILVSEENLGKEENIIGLMFLSFSEGDDCDDETDPILTISLLEVLAV